MDEAFALTERLRDEGLTLVHPFDDPMVIAGQGTVGLELVKDADALTSFLSASPGVYARVSSSRARSRAAAEHAPFRL
jgi:threonine dehydratase